MQILWQLEKGFVKDIIKFFPRPKPAYNTVSTIIRILEKKGFVGHKAYGNTHEYFTLVPKKDYRKFSFRDLLSNYFNNSYEHLVSFITKEEKIGPDEMTKIMDLISSKKENKPDE